MCHIRISNRWSSIMVNPTPWSVVAEYYRLVSRGVDDSPPTSPDRCSNPTNHVKYPVSVVQRFFQTMLMPDVTSVGGVGVEAHVTEWKNISAIYPDFDMRIVRIEEGPSGEVVVASKTILTFSEDTFRNAYPHMLDNSNKNVITAKLWGQKIEVATVAHFVWNNTMGRIAEIMFQVDMIPPLVQVLGSLELVANLFSYAFLTPEGHVVVA
ncbi:hypothetical protein PHMEG_0003503 [Phytophthora megakarya]|uniref:Uncharacterized protein n=1 Tax=Phytophthora megakarya TaxID=4795 RepID=A0A225WW28_9STRA|nr:hypothetical protein PHMEG_0003503 [Phytophthora megakarya]